MGNNNVKKRYWAFVGYPESLPEDWQEILALTGLPIAYSPLHDKDTEADGTQKKPHYHFILCYSGPTTFASVKRLTDKLKQPIPIPLESVKGYFRYFTHMDNPDKFQYSSLENNSINGFDISDFTEMTKSEQLKIKKEIFDFIEMLDIQEFWDLIQELKNADETGEKIDIAVNHPFLFNTYLKSRRHKIQQLSGNKQQKNNKNQQKREENENV